MLFWKCLTWPESEPRTRSHIFEADQRPSSDPLSSHRRLVPRHHCRADGEKGRQPGSEQEAQVAQRGIPTPAGQPGETPSMPGSHSSSGTMGRSEPMFPYKVDILLLECLPPLRQFYKLGAGLGVILQIRKATSRPSFTHKPMSARSNYLIKSIKFDLTSILHQLLIRPAHFDTHM